jgi:hypothetical protein
MGQDGEQHCFCCVYRQKLLAGKWKENAKYLMRTFTCRSTFLYGTILLYMLRNLSLEENPSTNEEMLIKKLRQIKSIRLLLW